MCPGNAGGTKFALCFICKERGHLSKNCPKNTRGIYPKVKQLFMHKSKHVFGFISWVLNLAYPTDFTFLNSADKLTTIHGLICRVGAVRYVVV